jgi:lipoprotein-anchoring transpeptidase ErfK/SrfK
MRLTPLFSMVLLSSVFTVQAHAQYGGGWGYAPPPEAPLQVFVDRDGNRIYVDQYGDVVDVERIDRGWQGQSGRTLRGPNGDVLILEGPADEYGWGGYEPAPVERYDYRGFPPPPPPPGVAVERTPLPAPDAGGSQFARPQPVDPNGQTGGIPPQGPRPYTPPSAAGQPPVAAQAPAAAHRGTAETAALQIYLDRAGASPGVIDGLKGSNVAKALDAYERMYGSRPNADDIDALMARLQETGGLPITQYTITDADVAGPFISHVPVDYSEKAQLEAMSYTGVTEKLAERFHMDEAYLKAINPNADFNRAGTVIKVANVQRPDKGAVTRIVADKSRKQVFGYGANGDLVVAYPATIGSQATPSPTGSHTVERIAIDPEYTYNPKINFKQGDNDKVLRIPPGPNGPVGSVWIALSKPTYGIHGTPEPSAIGKTESNGCIRLTNWDAAELAKLVKPGVTVEFVDEENLMVSDIISDAAPMTQTLNSTVGTASAPLAAPIQ